MTTTVSFTYTGAKQSWVVPAGVTNISYTIYGSASEDGNNVGNGFGGKIAGTLPVSPGDTLDLYVGSTPYNTDPTDYKGFYGGWGWAGHGIWGKSGGDGGANYDATLAVNGYGRGGGGASAIERNVDASNWLAIVAGGGGGWGYFRVQGGHGGGVVGVDGTGGTNATGGKGGTATAGGAAGGAGATAGQLGVGGKGAPQTNSGSSSAGGGGGGGGLYGGGGGGAAYAANGSGGGGGSSGVLITGSIAAPTVTENTAGVWSDHLGGRINITYEVNPLAPTLTAPADGLGLDQAQPVAFEWTFNPGETGQAQGVVDFHWRPVGGSTWTELLNVPVTSLGSNNYRYTAPGGAFSAYTDQSIEWQVSTHSASLGTASPYSTSRTFIPTVPPAAPTITPKPTITNQTPTLAWTTPNSMVSYAYRVTNDNAGAPGTVLYESATTAVAGAPTAKSIVLDPYGFSGTNTYHLQVRYQHVTGIWSAWADSGAIVANVNAPLTPSAVVSPDTDSGTIVVTTINPSGDPYPPDHNDIYRTDLTNAGDEERVVTGLVPNGIWVDVRPAYNTLYRYRVVAVSAEGAWMSSE